MNAEDRARLESAVLRRTAATPTWLGYWLERHCSHAGMERAELARRLGIDMERYVLLCLCRSPRDDVFADDIAVVCRRTGASATVLANIIRLERSTEKWKAAGTGGERGSLMAASERRSDGKPRSRRKRKPGR